MHLEQVMIQDTIVATTEKQDIINKFIIAL